jgi:TorA maturation chaperone TorD
MPAPVASLDATHRTWDRLAMYKALSVAFAYPDGPFFTCFPQLTGDRDALVADYDRLFRTGTVWLYGAEHLADNEFQRVDYLADINGFYRAFGLQPCNDRPDALTSELEFMYYLVFKWDVAAQAGNVEHADVCLNAQRKFFADHLLPGAMRIAQTIITRAPDGFYAAVAAEMVEFLERESDLLRAAPLARE